MTPAEHYARAEQLLARVTDMDATLPICRNLTAQAHVHALLATYKPPPEYTFRDQYNSARRLRAKDKYL